VVSIPDSGGRYYQMPMLDLWTDVFASPGKRTAGTGPQRYAIVGPHWTGTLPEGVEALHAPTSLGWIICRTQADGPSDYAGACAFQAGLRAQPLSAFERSYASGGAGIGARIAPNAPASTSTPVNQVALMDGATPFRLYWSVILPLLRPAIITVIVVSSVAIYNDFVNPLYFLPGNDNATVQLTLFNFQSQFNTRWNLLFADVLLITIPPLIMFIFFQRQLASGLTAGAVKG